MERTKLPEKDKPGEDRDTPKRAPDNNTIPDPEGEKLPFYTGGHVE